MEFRPATVDDLKYFMETVPCTARAWAAEQDGTIYGVGGVYYQHGHVIAFTNMRDDMPKRDIIRAARFLTRKFKDIAAPVYAIPACRETARRTLEHFGFVPIEGSDYYIWRGA